MTKRLDYRKASPDGLKALLAADSYVRACGLPNDLVNLVYLRCSQINGCAFCIDMHSHDLLKAGVSTDKLMLLAAWREAGAMFSKQEQAALAWAERVTKIADGGVEDEDYEAAIQVFSEKELTDLTIGIGAINAFNRMGISFKATPTSVRKLQQALA